jgi:hypothetical protein
VQLKRAKTILFSGMSNSTNTVVHFDGKGNDLNLRLRARSHIIHPTQVGCSIFQPDTFLFLIKNVITQLNMTSFFRFAIKRAIYLNGKISLAHARCTHLN